MDSLRAAFEAVSEFRQWHQYDLAGILTFRWVAMMGGGKGEREIARWGQAQRWTLAERLGFRRYRMPSLGTIQRIVRCLDGNNSPKSWGPGANGHWRLRAKRWRGSALMAKPSTGVRPSRCPRCIC